MDRVTPEEAIRAFLERQAPLGRRAEFCQRAGLEESNLSNVLNKLPGRHPTVGWLNKVAAGLGWRSSVLFRELALVAEDLERMSGEFPAVPPRRPKKPQ